MFIRSNQAIKDSPDRRILVTIFAIASIAIFFWLGSRYPALNEKAAMGGDSPLSGLSFDIALEIFPNSGLWWEILANTVNWIYTNIKGMSFGVLFGAGALTLLSLIKKRAFKSSFANSALGVLIGAPLGVCVNCAAPIALGLHAGRMRLETTLSALVASPTLNIIVVTMSFALLPIHLAVIKLVLALAMVLLVVPLICRWILVEETNKTATLTGAKISRISEPKGFAAWIIRALTPIETTPEPHSLFDATKWLAKAYSRNFFFIFIITVPMMILAALLGALVATFTAPAELVGLFPSRGLIYLGVTLILVAGIASFVPAPIALDVILTVILLGIGLNNSYAVAILIALGSFSVYAFIILWQAISIRTGLVLWMAVIGMSVIGGLMAHFSEPYAKHYYRTMQIAAINAVDGIDFPQAEPLPPGTSLTELRPRLDKQSVMASPLEGDISSSAQTKISIVELKTPRPILASSSKGSSFSRLIGPEIGLLERGVITPLRELGYHLKGGGLAAGDIHGDGWTDIITRRPTLSSGLSIYTNIGGGYHRQDVDLGPVNESEVFNLALADIDGDSQLDLLVSTIRNGEYLFYNEGGNFSQKNMVQLYEAEQAVLSSMGFADLDGDGDIDIVAGKWAPRGVSIGWGLEPFHTQNQIYWNEGNRKFRRDVIPNSSGQTLTLLISDFDHDGRLDILDGDDTASTDAVVFLNEDRTIRSGTPEDQPFAYFIHTTMSYTQGDWNNDLSLDYYGAQISRKNEDTGKFRANNRKIYEVCMQLGKDLEWDKVQIRECAAEAFSIDNIKSNKANANLCPSSSSARDRALCGSAEIIRSFTNKSRSLEPDLNRHQKCTSFFDHIPLMQRYCDSLLMPVAKRKTRQERAQIYQGAVQNRNILMTSDENGNFSDKASDAGVGYPGWSWNSRLSDLDQDGREDLLVMTGIWQRLASATTNVFYHNQGSHFTDATDQFGFHDLTPSFGYVQLDFDRDGDVDIIRDNMALRMIVHRNDNPAGPALWISLRDKIGNRLGIGAKITICTDGEVTVRVGKCQMRVIHASGGYMSSDPIVAHFGLGNAKSVSLIEIRWPDGEISTIKPTSLLGGDIRIKRE